MREPKGVQIKPATDIISLRTTSPIAPTKARRARAVPGGKALARLRLFELARGFDPGELEHTASTRPLTIPAPGGRRGRSRAGQRYGESPYLLAFQQAQKMERMAPAVPVPLAWVPLGPFSIPHGQTYGSGSGSRPSVSGRVAAIAVDPGNANHLLLGAAGGGIWESTNGGGTWEPRTDEQPALATGAIAFDPSNPQTVYAGTGEGNFYSSLGVGILRSTDGGTTWALIPATSGVFAGRGFYDLIVDPLNGNHLLAATTGGLYESTNGGATWAQRRAAQTWDLSMHPPVGGNPQSTREVFAACDDGVFSSNNGGTTWNAVALPGAPTTWTRIAVAHAPSNGNVVYVFGADIPPPPPGAPRDPNPFLWRRATANGGFTAQTLLAGLGTGQAWYDWFIGVAPNDPDLVYLGAIDLYQGARAGGGTWTWEVIDARAAGSSIHPDQHAIAFSPIDPAVVYIGNDGGLFRSPDAGITWQSLNKNLCITEIEYLAQHPQFDAWLIAGTQDNGTMRFEGEETWFHVADGDGGYCGVNANSPYTSYHTYWSLSLERSTTGGGWGSWNWIAPPAPANFTSLFYPPIAVNGDIVAIAGSAVLISTDDGNTWTSVALPAPPLEVATILAIPSTTRVYAGTWGGSLYRIDFTGGAWQAPVLVGRPRAGWMSDLLIDPTNPNRIWTTYSFVSGEHVFRSDNGGAAWNNVSAGLPVISVNAVEIDPANPDTVFVAADVGVYRSTDAGATWTAFSNGLPNAMAEDLLFHNQMRLLRVGLRSRGVWEIPVDQVAIPDVQIYLRDDTVDTGRTQPAPSGVPDPFNVGSQEFWWQCPDIKVDALPYQQPLPADVDFSVFDDDHGVFASGLIHENAQRGRTVRVFVQVHNRGVRPATNVAVKVFFADASLGLPMLPAGFWTGFPGNALPGNSPWQAVAPHQVVASVEAGHAAVVEFDWPVPAGAAGHTCLLAITTADNDGINTTELNPGNLVPNEPKCGLKNLTVVDPPIRIGPWIRLVELNMWGVGEGGLYEIGVDRGGTSMVRGLMLSRPLAGLAREHGLRATKPTEEELSELSSLLDRRPRMKERLDMSSIFALPKPGPLLRGIKLRPEQHEPLIAFLAPKHRKGRWSIVQWDEDGRVVGGYTFEAIGPDGFDKWRIS